MKWLIWQNRIVKPKHFRQLILLILGIILSITHASAYIGPATVTMIWQITLASLLAAGYLVHIYWDRIKSTIKKQFNRSAK